MLYNDVHLGVCINFESRTIAFYEGDIFLKIWHKISRNKCKTNGGVGGIGAGVLFQTLWIYYSDIDLAAESPVFLFPFFLPRYSRIFKG